MFQHNHPYGISISQAKKDAKKLAKTKNIPLNKAQDTIAFQHGRSTWAEIMQQMKQSLSLSFPDTHGVNQLIKLPDTASISFILGMSGSGKSALCYELMAQFAQQKIHSTYISKGIVTHTPNPMPAWFFAENRLLRLKEKHLSLIHFHDSEKWLNVEKTALRGGILIVDEYYFLAKIPGLHDLMSAARHTFVVAQSFNDCLSLPDTAIDSRTLSCYLFALHEHEEQTLLTNLEKEFSVPKHKVYPLFEFIRSLETSKRRMIHLTSDSQPLLLEIHKDKMIL